MSLESVDRALQEWDERLRRIDESLLALEAEPTYQMLAPRSSPRPRLRGETARLVVPALDALGDVFEHRARLTELLDRAKAHRAEMGRVAFWGRDAEERAIVALLDGPSIELPPTMTPLARRSLLDPASQDTRAYPGQILQAMVAAFDRARDAVVAVQHAWDRIEPAMQTIEAQVQHARASAASLGVEAAIEAELVDVASQLDAARASIAEDPLGESADRVARLGPRVDAIVARLGELAAQRARVEGGLAEARATLERAPHVRQAARDASEAFPREIAGAVAPGAPSTDDAATDLASWLEKLESTAAAGRWSSVEVGLGRWMESARAALAGDERIAAAFAAVLARRDEIAGRLSARRAQAAARGKAIDPALEDVAREAERLLARRPTPLAEASALVERYETALRSTR